MKIKDFFKEADGVNAVIIKDNYDCSAQSFSNHTQAVASYGHFTIQKWNVKNDIIHITIRSQF